MKDNNKTKLNFWLYLVIGLLVAFLIERGAATAGDSKLFQNPVWPIGFLLWYGLLLLISYLVFRNKPLWMVALAWAIIGPVIELILFRGHIRVTDIFYGIIFVTPLWVARHFSLNKHL